MRRLRQASCMFGLCLAAGSVAALDVDEARHLLVRTGFGAAPHEIRALLPLSREQAVDRLIGGLDAQPGLPPMPAFARAPVGIDSAMRLGADYVAGIPDVDGATYERLTHRGMQEMEQLRVWWLDRMISTPNPFAERLALFWHGHFTTKYFDVLAPRLIADGTRDFSALMRAMVRDPAMQIFLDNAFNTRERPNENLARELLELFTMGVGHYGEGDVKALASVLAGHGVDFAHGWRYRVRPDRLDTRPRRFLGEAGVRTLRDAERVILRHRQTARFIAERLYREFVSTDADEAEIAHLAAALRRHRYALRPVLRDMLLRKAFWSPANRGLLVKSPVELLVGFVRTTGLPLPDLGLLVEDARLLGQELFEPPTVKGWPVGMEWLNMRTLRLRSDRLASLWQCRESTAAWLDARGDLLVRFSAEREGDAPVRLRLLADGREVVAAQARCPAGRLGAGQGIPKPAWDLLRVPRALLPPAVRSIDVVFDRNEQERSVLFVNWVQIDGRRLPAHRAEQRFDAGTPCAGNEPPGMLYCAGHLRFDLTAAPRTDASLEDRAQGLVNAVIESGTARLHLGLRPAGRRTTVDVQAWRGLPLLPSLLPADPLGAPAEHRTPGQMLEAALFDPTFNLK